MIITHQQTVNPFDEVVDVTKTTRLAAISEHCKVLATESLSYKCGEHSSVVQPHPRTVSIEYSCNPCLYSVIIVIRHRDRLHETLGFVITTAWSYRVNISPVFFCLRMHMRITIYFACRGNKYP